MHLEFEFSINTNDFDNADEINELINAVCWHWSHNGGVFSPDEIVSNALQMNCKQHIENNLKKMLDFKF